MTDIGKPKRTIEVEPIEVPVPETVPETAPETVPEPVPA